MMPWHKRPEKRKKPNGDDERLLLLWFGEEIRDLRNQSDRRFLFLVLLVVGSIVSPFLDRAIP